MNYPQLIQGPWAGPGAGESSSVTAAEERGGAKGDRQQQEDGAGNWGEKVNIQKDPSI